MMNSFQPIIVIWPDLFFFLRELKHFRFYVKYPKFKMSPCVNFFFFNKTGSQIKQGFRTNPVCRLSICEILFSQLLSK